MAVVVPSAVFVEDVGSVVPGVDAAVTALAVEAAVAIAAAAIVSGVPELPEVEADAELIIAMAIGGSAAIGTCAMVIVGVAVALASVDWLSSVELLSDEELSLLFEPSDFVLLLCEAELPLLLLLSPLFAPVCELPWSLLLAGGLFAWFGWFWFEEGACELLLLGVFRLGGGLSFAERCGGGGGGAGGSRFEGSGGRLLSTIEAKLLASCEASGRAALSAALGGAL